ncbi:hypothetical protein IW146_007374 [Coemansia sp. RSA 922]|nr:hypothetical protein IW146_007374 [Coemansia sp. RSA 922]
MEDTIKAVIFDVGGVLVKSPFIAISAYERELGLPGNYINVSLSRQGADGAFQRYERGELSYGEFVDQWTEELNDTEANNLAYHKYLQRHELDTRAWVAALTNNFRDAGDSDKLKPLFDVFVESAVEGLRKPDPRFYLQACNRLEVSPNEALFLDDIPVNVRAAKELGMEVIRVEIGRETLAVDKVKRILRARGAYSSAKI